jgi:hypothetical protein
MLQVSLDCRPTPIYSLGKLNLPHWPHFSGNLKSTMSKNGRNVDLSETCSYETPSALVSRYLTAGP